MRRSLKIQILIRVVLLLSVTVAGITFANIRATAIQSQQRRTQQVDQISELLSTSRFPLTSNVLNDMNSLSGVEFIVTNSDGSVFSQTTDAPDIGHLVQPPSPSREASGPIEQWVELDGKKYVYRSVAIKNQRTQSTRVHVLVSQQSNSELWWRSAKPSLMIAAIIFPIASILALAMAGGLIRPLAALKQQVQNIARGQLKPIPLPPRDDEIRDLSISVNEMSSRLEDFESETRNNARLQTLLQVGSGMAHNLRNCATGCKMAIELLESENQSLVGCENLAVAQRQISLMSKYIDRFIKLSQSGQIPGRRTVSPIDVRPILDSVVELLCPTAKHLNVQLSIKAQGAQSKIRIHPDDFEQLCINLISNAITATSEHHIRNDLQGAAVSIDMAESGNGHLELTVTDNGPGPDPEIATTLFDPLVSGTREGIGLGLSLSAEIVERASGEICWNRIDDETHFCVLIPVDHDPAPPDTSADPAESG